MQLKIKFKFDRETSKVKLKINESSKKVDSGMDEFYENAKVKGFTKSTARAFLYGTLSEYVTDTKIETYSELINDQEIQKETLKESTVFIDSKTLIDSLTQLSAKLFS